MSSMALATIPAPTQAAPRGKSPLLADLRSRARARGDPESVADNLAAWARAFILFHDKRHPSGLGLRQVTQFLEHVVKASADPLPALAQARAALTLLFGGVLGIHLGELPQPRPPRGSCRIARAPGGSGGTTSWKVRCSARSRKQAWPRDWIAPSIVTRFATVSRRTWSNAERTSAASSCCWATRAWKQP